MDFKEDRQWKCNKDDLCEDVESAYGCKQLVQTLLGISSLAYLQQRVISRHKHIVLLFAISPDQRAARDQKERVDNEPGSCTIIQYSDMGRHSTKTIMTLMQ